MARFRGRSTAQPDLFVPVAVGAVVMVLLVLLIWFLVDRTGFMIWWNSLAAAVHR